MYKTTILFLSIVLCGLSCGPGVAAVGSRFDYSPKGCGQNGLRDAKRAIQVIVVGVPGSLRCRVWFTEKLLAASNFRAGYACVSSSSAKPAMIVRKNDPKVVRERGYAKKLADAEEWGRILNLPVEVVYIRTSDGPPHPEKRCAKDQ